MKKLLYILVFSFLVLPNVSQAETVDEIKEFYDNDHETFLDTFWVRPREIYDEWSNGSRFMRSSLMAKYNRVGSRFSFHENLGDYLKDEPLSWSHKLTYHVKLIQLYRKSHKKILDSYKVVKVGGKLQITHREYGFAIGHFNKWGKYDTLGYGDNIGDINLHFWNQVFFDPWEEKMWFRENIDAYDEKYTGTTKIINADDFLFRFKRDKKLYRGRIAVEKIPGFKYATCLFVFQGKKSPVSTDRDTQIEWDKKTITFDAGFTYDVRRLTIGQDGIVVLNQTRNDFLSPITQ